MQCPHAKMAEQPRYCPLRNMETGNTLSDRLYSKAKAKTGCNGKKCVGSIMGPEHMTTDARKNVRTKEEMLDLAKDFIRQYHEEIDSKGDAEMNRLNEVLNSIEKTGTYELTKEELSFGAKTAWRNASRCIGRFQWRKLTVFDYRHVTTTAEMFDAICTHLKYSINGGTLRSGIIFFPKRTDYKKDFRIWNGQYWLYAGYKQPDGSVVGDSNNVEITELCIKMGWKPKGGRFDVLPLLLQANGEDPVMYEFPPEMIFEVKLRHPTYKSFEQLGFKWFGIPVISGLLLDIGGIEFPATPLNGWFMSTEIARDLCDVQRYNALEEVALNMGMDTKNPLSLWKDKALVEVNVAVLHSFKADKVTITDHHSAAEAFMKHFAEEMRTRGGCPSDWVWLTPPISGGLSPVFHQEMLNYTLSPSYQYQPPAWKYHVWKRSDFIKSKNTLKFRAVARTIFVLSSLMRKAMQRRTKVTILYATETGKSLEYAKMLQKIFNHAFSAKVTCMKDYAVERLKIEKLLLVVTSTFGNGDAPDTGAKLYKDFVAAARSPALLNGNGKTNGTNGTNGTLKHLRFSVFGLGSRAYPHFCNFAHKIDTVLGNLAGQRLLKIKEGDELSGQEESFREWAREIFQTSCGAFEVSDANLPDILKSDGRLISRKFRISQVHERSRHLGVVEGLSMLHQRKVSTCTLLRRTTLQSDKSDRATILVEIKLPNASEMKYQPGDHVSVFPSNQPGLVDRLLSRVRTTMDVNVPMEIEISEGADSTDESNEWKACKRLPICSVRKAFARYLDITSPPTPQMLKLLADSATDAKEKEALLILSKGKSVYEVWKLRNHPNIADVLDDFPSIDIDASLLLSQLPLLKYRLYSISSSPHVHPEQVHCTVAVVKYKTQDGEGQTHFGVCSSYLNRLPIGSEIHCCSRPVENFYLPKKQEPVLLIGPGTGIAPFRSFWQQRSYEIQQGKSFGPLALIFGCRHPDRDHLYKNEVEEAMKVGAVTHYETAFSRIPGKPKQYVQDILRGKLRNLVYDFLVKKEGHVYICGDVTMADDAERALVQILVQEGDISKRQAMEHIHKMKEKRRFHADIFGVTLRVREVQERFSKRNAAPGRK